MASKFFAQPKQVLMFPTESSWKVPTDLPNLRDATVVAFDLETKDEGLQNGKGPGWCVGKGCVIGVSLAWEGGAIYLPINHPETANWDHGRVGAFLRELFSQEGTTIVGHNISYDLGWTETEWGIKPPKNIGDTGALAVFITESLLSYSLDGICRWIGIPGKDTRLMDQAAADRGIPKGKVSENMWRLPAQYVGPYAETDAVVTLAAYHALLPRVIEEGVYAAYLKEMRLIPMTLAMRRRGIRIDENAVDQTIIEFNSKLTTTIASIRDILGRPVSLSEFRSGKKMVEIFDSQSLDYPRTAAGNPSFESSWMKDHPAQLPRLITRAKQIDDAANKFLGTYIRGYNQHGRIYASINQFKSENGGTRSHRFSYSDPPLQQMPSRDDELAPRIRRCFLPEFGSWYAIDYSQQEYRLIVHVAYILQMLPPDKLPPGLHIEGADIAVRRYREDPTTDFHNYVVEITRLIRRRAKDVNFAKAFGAGVAQFAIMTGMSPFEAKSTMAQYDRELPFVSQASKVISTWASQRGYVRLLDGAKVHYDLWEEDCFEKGQTARPYAAAVETWGEGNIRRAYTHKAFNHLVQGSAARQMKTAMLDIWDAGYCPMIQIHDELGFSFDNPDDARACGKLMVDAIPLSIPMSVDIERGPSWGDAKEKII
jgi:DNA polymerase-1